MMTAAVPLAMVMLDPILCGEKRISALGCATGLVRAAFLGTLLAAAIDVAETPGIDWIELALQIGLAAAGVAIVAGTRGRSRV